MNLWIALLVFLCSITDDILCVLYYRRVNAKDKKLQAGGLSAALTMLVCFGVIYYTSDWRYAIPNIIGSAIGTPLAIWIDERFPKKRARASSGKFKVPVTPIQAIQQTEKGI